MKKLTIMALIAAQVMVAAEPALAADLTDTQTQQAGVFAGFRLRVPLDGQARQPVRAGLTVVPTLHSRSLSGESRTRFADGLELGIAGDRPLQLSLAGTPVSRLAQGPAGPDGPRAGVSTIAWVAIGVVALVGTLFVVGQLCADGEICGTTDE